MRYPRWRLLLFMAIASVPIYWTYQGATSALGPDPGKELVDNLGQGALVLLLASLAMSPLQKLTSWPGWIAFRRQLGLWSFSYATLHLAAYLYFLLGFDFTGFTAELIDRPYIAVGAIALMGLSVLAATSTRWSMRKLGKRWKKLHQIIYPVLLVVLLHMLWVVRADAGRWALYATISAVLLVARLPPVEKRLVTLGRGSRLNKTETNR
ncbi:protein-methionine-sulfoxide reductase heme-binding subunit MsrQ [Pseudomonas knackmussii]|uniref:Protein-methionine-sulfoxide reductase heme-binding subunit MsrQ n=1 Tax=Pseudomonas knackmussii TaxID=65741 RepID=A0ABY4KRQ0_9PSED|nr:protein-methionine-sulfoxide reductase heme-binding subunit MsrQ [Pseudomonas knackmussii]UPQ81922.1 protein-methionine-sulfoxide reductase heme-binding subunit MsrQ [Pseudomonas knackmussii]